MRVGSEKVCPTILTYVQSLQRADNDACILNHLVATKRLKMG